jgi:hypothetical protein
VQTKEIVRFNKILADFTCAPPREIKQIAVAATETSQGSARTFAMALCGDGSLWKTELSEYGAETWQRVSPLPLPARVREQPLTPVEIVGQLECCALAGSAWAQQRLKEIEHSHTSALPAKTAAAGASRRLFIQLGHDR